MTYSVVHSYAFLLYCIAKSNDYVYIWYRAVPIFQNIFILGHLALKCLRRVVSTRLVKEERSRGWLYVLRYRSLRIIYTSNCYNSSHVLQTPGLRDKLSINPEDRLSTGDTPVVANQLQKQVTIVVICE